MFKAGRCCIFLCPWPSSPLADNKQSERRISMVPGLPINAPCQSEDISRTAILWRIGVSDVMPPVYVPSRKNRREQGSRRYVAALYCCDFWGSNLIYLELDGNNESLARLEAIVVEKNKFKAPHTCDVHILNFNEPLPESVVSDLLSVRGEGLRPLLDAHLQAPFSDGWKDCNKWVLRNMSQFKLDGQLAKLPWRPPDDYEYLSYLETGWDDYPDRLVGFFLKSDYIRPWAQSAWYRIVPVD